MLPGCVGKPTGLEMTSPPSKHLTSSGSYRLSSDTQVQISSVIDTMTKTVGIIVKNKDD